MFSLRSDVCALWPEPIATSLSCRLAGLRCRAGPCGRLFRRHLRDPDNHCCKGDAVVSAAPFLAAILGWIFLNEVVKRSTGVAIFVASIGIAIMVIGQTEGGALIGTLAGLGSALGFAIFTVALRWGKSADMMPSILLSGLFAIIITICVCWQTGLSFVIRPNDAGISMAMGIFQVGAGLILYTLGSKTVPAAELALLSLAEVLLVD